MPPPESAAASLHTPAEHTPGTEACERCRRRGHRCPGGFPCALCLAANARCQMRGVRRPAAPRGGSPHAFLPLSPPPSATLGILEPPPPAGPATQPFFEPLSTSIIAGKAAAYAALLAAQGPPGLAASHTPGALPPTPEEPRNAAFSTEPALFSFSPQAVFPELFEHGPRRTSHGSSSRHPGSFSAAASVASGDSSGPSVASYRSLPPHRPPHTHHGLTMDAVVVSDAGALVPVLSASLGSPAASAYSALAPLSLSPNPLPFSAFPPPPQDPPEDLDLEPGAVPLLHAFAFFLPLPPVISRAAFQRCSGAGGQAAPVPPNLLLAYSDTLLLLVLAWAGAEALAEGRAELPEGACISRTLDARAVADGLREMARPMVARALRGLLDSPARGRQAMVPGMLSRLASIAVAARMMPQDRRGGRSPWTGALLAAVRELGILPALASPVPPTDPSSFLEEREWLRVAWHLAAADVLAGGFSSTPPSLTLEAIRALPLPCDDAHCEAALQLCGSRSPVALPVGWARPVVPTAGDLSDLLANGGPDPLPALQSDALPFLAADLLSRVRAFRGSLPPGLSLADLAILSLPPSGSSSSIPPRIPQERLPRLLAQRASLLRSQALLSALLPPDAPDPLPTSLCALSLLRLLEPPSHPPDGWTARWAPHFSRAALAALEASRCAHAHAEAGQALRRLQGWAGTEAPGAQVGLGEAADACGRGGW
ncbi:hypothetical protein DFJ74DRAFT_771050 [Hyaloraphidium curvatum]|nr:hypothetical protein DFJ74DRAFT_771047 [Hyaloraphidium curvatum]KAI9014017.1 hypothetical protein DFJ74DRAFT_771050 [Hyaloraphidium curvatum]